MKGCRKKMKNHLKVSQPTTPFFVFCLTVENVYSRAHNTLNLMSMAILLLNAIPAAAIILPLLHLTSHQGSFERAS